MKTYSELMSIPTFEGRFAYLQEGLIHNVGTITFGSMRYTNQRFYNSGYWKEIRHGIIVRDDGCDLAVPGYEISHMSLIRVHHINPLTPESFDEEDPMAYDPENLITMASPTHRALTYGGIPPQRRVFIERKPGDHILWRK